jgi:signal transduction histidine kinase
MLLVITTVVSIITFTMANLFHSDKTAYIHDFTSEMAVHMAAETHSMLVGYRERLGVFAQLMLEKELFQDTKSKLIKQLFKDFREFVAITLYKDGEHLATVYDAKALEDAGLTKKAFLTYRTERPLPLDRILAGEVYIENSTISENFPTLTLAISHHSSDSKQDVVMAVVIRLNSLLQLTRRSKVFTGFITDYEGNPIAHTDLQRVIQRGRVAWIQETESLQSHQIHGTTVEFFKDNEPMVGGLAHVNFGSLLAGVQIPKTAAYLTSRELLNNLIVVSLAILMISVVLSLFWSRYITRPLERLSNATEVVGKGKFDIQVVASSRDEIGDLATSFNQMASELDTRQKALNEAQAALVHSEKMAAFGQLGAGIAHEVKNPLAGILGLTQLSLRKTEMDSPVFKNLSMIEKETKRCKTVIENLLKFARQERVSFEPIEINSVVEATVAMVAHQLGIHQIKINTKLASDLPQIMGNANQIQQVLLNLTINAQQALKGHPGLVTITTRRHDGKNIEMRVSDTGPGIPAELKDKVFEPFFTTKPVGKGTGLGLSVSYGIVKEHKGDIRVESSPENGTVFVITLPDAR